MRNSTPRAFNCPDATCHRTMLHVTDEHYECPRCHCRVLFPAPADGAVIDARRVNEAKRFAVAFPALNSGFHAWVQNEAYWDGRGYRLRANRRQQAPWSKLARKFYPDMSDFHEAARLACPVSDE